MIDLCTIFEEFSVAITITDLEGTIIYMNEQSAQVNAKGGGKALVGKQVRDCHTERSKNIIAQLFQGATNAYTIEKKETHLSSSLERKRSDKRPSRIFHHPSRGRNAPLYTKLSIRIT